MQIPSLTSCRLSATAHNVYALDAKPPSLVDFPCPAPVSGQNLTPAPGTDHGLQDHRLQAASTENYLVGVNGFPQVAARSESVLLSLTIEKYLETGPSEGQHYRKTAQVLS